MNCAHLKRYADPDAAADDERPDQQESHIWPCSECNNWHITATPPRITLGDL